MASGSQSMTTYYAKRIVGDASAAQANSALLQTGANVTADTWILNRTNRATTYGIKYVYDGTDGQDKIEFYGGTATASAWVQLDTGDTYIAGKLGINYNPETSGNNYQLYVNGNAYIYQANSNVSTQQAPGLRVNGKIDIYDNVTGGGVANSLLNILYNGTHDYGVPVKIHSYGGDSPAIRFSKSASIDDINSEVNTSWTVGMYYNSTDAFAITRGRGPAGWGTADLVINSSGQVGIGTTTPVYKLDINGTAHISGITTLGSRETTTGPSSLTSVDRLVITPYFHTGGPWYIKSMDNSSDAFLALYYGNSELLRIKHEGTFQADIKANITGNAATATKLQTARSLWGNNFDGTAAISGNITISHGASATMTADSTNPKITFSENGSQPVHLIYTDYDSYRSPAGLKVVGGTSASPAWFEVEGQVYAARFNGPVTGNVTGNCSGSSGSCTGNAATATNADKVDNYHASDLWRKDGGTWNGNANIACTPTANNQEYSFDLGNAYTGTYWHVWSGKNSKSILVCYNDNMNVSVPNGTLSAKAFSGPLTGNVTGNCSGSSGSCTGNAATATKLQTARAINGTNFDGSGAITTANWGTARTLTIGYKGQSVNGSANISWSARDILHNTSITIGETTSWNIIDAGIYNVSSGKAFTGTNNPGTGQNAPYTYGHLIVTRSSDTYGIAQFYISHVASGSKAANKGIRYRSGWNGNNGWQTWATILDDKNYNLYSPTLTGGGASGSWGISVTGSSASCTGNAATATRINGNLGAISSNTNCNIWVSSTSSADGIPKYVSGVYVNASTKAIYATKVYSAVWNDYAEFRVAESEEPGRVVIPSNDGIARLATSRLQPGGRIISDTYGHAVGQSDQAKTPIGLAGRVLAYPYRDKSEYKIGDAVCSAPGGTIDIMTREEIMTYPDRIVGIVNEIPDYKIWEQTFSEQGDCEKMTQRIEVKGRIWIDIK